MSVPGRFLALASALALVAFAAAALGAEQPDPALKRWPAWPYRVGCSSLAVDPIKAFSQPTGAERGSGDGERVLRRFLASSGQAPKHGWRTLVSTPERAEFVHGRLDDGLLWVGFDLPSLSSRPLFGGPTRCAPRSFRAGNPATSWSLYPDLPAPQRSAESVVVGIQEFRCTGGRNPVGHLERPHYVRYGKRAIVVIFWTTPLEGPQLCPANPLGRLELQLPGPLGDRKLFDGSTYPPRRVRPGEVLRYPGVASRSAFLRQ